MVLGDTRHRIQLDALARNRRDVSRENAEGLNVTGRDDLQVDVLRPVAFRLEGEPERAVLALDAPWRERGGWLEVEMDAADRARRPVQPHDVLASGGTQETFAQIERNQPRALPG